MLWQQVRARHFAFAIGKGGTDNVNKWFNTSLCIHLVLPRIFNYNRLANCRIRHPEHITIPPERIKVCILVFRISLISAFVNMGSVPFVAMFTAKQRLAEIALWGILQSGMVFALSWILTQVPADRLLYYATGMVSIQITTCIIKISRAIFLFPECLVRLQRGFRSESLERTF